MTEQKASLKDIINKYVSIIDIANEHGLKLEPACSGNFDYRCKCPSVDHNGGSEKTPSLYLSSSQNKYYCFGCTSSGGPLNLYMICADTDFQTAIEVLSVDIQVEHADKIERKVSNIDVLSSISVELRKAMKNHPSDLKWMSFFMKQVDDKIDLIDIYDVPSAIKLREKVIAALQKRFN